MKRTIITLFIGGSLLLGCTSNQRSSKSYGKARSSAAIEKPEEKPADASSEITVKEEPKSINEAEQPQSALDSLLMSPEADAYTKPRGNFQGASGVGTGGSYASSSYRHDEMNKKKHEKEALAKKERNLQNQQMLQEEDSLSVESENNQYSW